MNERFQISEVFGGVRAGEAFPGTGGAAGTPGASGTADGDDRYRGWAVRGDADVDGGDGADLTGRPVFGWQERPLPWMYEDPEDYRKDLVKFMEAFWNG